MHAYTSQPIILPLYLERAKKSIHPTPPLLQSFITKTCTKTTPKAKKQRIVIFSGRESRKTRVGEAPHARRVNMEPKY
jgi:hypothetical protein